RPCSMLQAFAPLAGSPNRQAARPASRRFSAVWRGFSRLCAAEARGCGPRTAGPGRPPAIARVVGLSLGGPAIAPAQKSAQGTHHRWVTGLLKARQSKIGKWYFLCPRPCYNGARTAPNPHVHTRKDVLCPQPARAQYGSCFLASFSSSSV